MAVQVLDSSNLVATLQADQDASAAEAKAVEDARQPAKQVETKPEPAKPAAEKPNATELDPDDIEGEDGLTPRQKREWTRQMQKTIAKKHRETKEAEEFAAAQYNEKRLLEQRLQEAERKLQTTQPAKAETKPERQNFQTDDEYIKATVTWEVKQELAKERADRERLEAEQKAAEVMAAAKERIAKAIELVPDFEDVTEGVDLEVPPHVAGYMQESEMFAELGYHFAKHPEDLTRLQKMHPARQLVEIGKIESTLQPFAKAANTNGAKPSSEVKNGTQVTESPSDTGTAPSKARVAAPVITPLNNSGSGNTGTDPRDMNVREMIQTYQKTNKVNFGLRKRH